MVGLGPRTNAANWTAEVQTHEHEKRRFVDPAFLKGPTVKVDRCTIMKHERAYDPLLQRFRDDATEAKQLALEEKERTAHLNLAMDVQILREHPFHVFSHESRVEPIAEKVQTRSIDMQDPNTMSMPTTCVDYNIISNLPFHIHHPGKPDERPLANERDPKMRKRQGAQLRDFNIVSNRYLTDHVEKSSRDTTLNTLHATEKYRDRVRFNPLTQKFNENEFEERHRCCDDAREVELRMRAEKIEPHCYRGRHSKHYDMITHRADDDGTHQLKLLDTLELQRKSHYKARYVDEHMRKLRDIDFEDTEANQRHEQVSHERWEETARRGYDIVTNKAYGVGPNFQKLHEPFTVPSLTTWEMVEENRSGTTPCATPSYIGTDDTRRPSVSTKGQSITTQEVLESARNGQMPPRDATPLSCGKRTPRTQSTSRVLPEARTPRTQTTPRVLSEAGSASIASARGRPPLLAMSGKTVQLSVPPPPPPIPGSPVGSVYSKPKL